jgi:hypothetical protein
VLIVEEVFMDKVFARFLEKMGKPIGRRDVPKASIERYEGRLPNLLLEYWVEHGWCGYGNGIFWLVDPQDYEGVVSSWIEGTKLEGRDTYHVIASSAFGDLYLWGENTGFSLKIDSCLARCVIHDFEIESGGMDRELQNFLLSVKFEYNDYGGLFRPALKKLGPLSHDKVYGFVPALILGGNDTLDHLEKVKAVEHLIFLSQLAPLEPYSFSDL